MEDWAARATFFYICLSNLVSEATGILTCVQLNVTFYYENLPSAYKITNEQASVIEKEYVLISKPILSTTCPYVDVGSSFSYLSSIYPPHWTTTLEFHIADISHSINNAYTCLENSGFVRLAANSSLWRISDIENTKATSTRFGRLKVSPHCCGKAICKSMCTPNPCHNANKCVLNGTTSFTCLCAPGYKAPLCERGHDQDSDDGTISTAYRASVIVILVLVTLFLILTLSIISAARRIRRKSAAEREEDKLRRLNHAFDEPDNL